MDARAPINGLTAGLVAGGDQWRERARGASDGTHSATPDSASRTRGDRMLPLRSLAMIAAFLTVAACSRDRRTTADSAGGTVTTDASDIGHPVSVTPAAGGAAQVTATDAKSVRLATEYRLTPENFSQFVKASDSLAVLRRHDGMVNALLSERITDAATGTYVSGTNAGVQHLESNAKINNAIVSTGMSVPDYFVASIAIAQAERFLDDPKAAPPTPVLGDNIRFLQQHRAELTAMRQRDRAQ
jgi:hypothetical protein